VGRVFVGQRKDPFYIYLGGVFDLVNFVPIEGFGSPTLEGTNADLLANNLRFLNIGAFAVEVHKSCLLRPRGGQVIGVWTRTRTKTTGKQVTRLGNPLVNELFIGLDDKDLWNKVTPRVDAQFNDYIEYPTLPKILDILFLGGVNALTNQSLAFIEPQLFPRTDLLALLHTGIAGLNQLKLQGNAQPVFADMLRLNTATPVQPYSSQNSLGVIGGDAAGYPNGRRPKDDVVDIFLRGAMGVLIPTNPAIAPAGSLPFTDFVGPTETDYTPFPSMHVFPFMADPLPGGVPNPLLP